jgi:YVTN family beta-propeller protein
MAVSADGKWAASTHGGSQDVAIINAADKTVAATVTIGKGPGFPIFSPDGTKLYVMNYGEGDVCVIDLASKKIVARYKAGQSPFGGGLRFPNGRPAPPH